MKSWRIRRLGKFTSGRILDYKSLYIGILMLHGRTNENKLKCTKQVVNKCHPGTSVIEVDAVYGSL
jgi:hypothetical protein